MIASSSYSEQANFENATKILVNEQKGGTSLPTYLERWTNQPINRKEYKNGDLLISELIKKLKEGNVAVVHTDYGTTEWGHWIAVLDYDAEKGIYISNPWSNAHPTGWQNPSVLGGNHSDISFYIADEGSNLNYDGGAVATLDNFLFIGDSRTELIESDLRKLGNNITAKGVSASKPSDWADVIKAGSGIVCAGTQFAKSVTLPSKSGIKGVSVALGVNATNQTKEMKEVLNNLLERYPDTPIFVNSVFNVGINYKYNWQLNATTMNTNIEKFNKEIKEFCNSNSNLVYIDITKDLHENNFLKASCTYDDLHLNDKGNKILVENIKNAILGSGKITSLNIVNMSRNIVKKEDGGYKIDINLEEEVEIMLERLEEEDYDISRYLNGWKITKKMILKNMLKAAIVTQYPDLRTAEDIASDKPILANVPGFPDEVQGCVKFKRYIDEETGKSFVRAALINPKDKDEGMYLSYMPYDEFMKLINDGNAIAMNHFSMDSSNNIIVAGWERMDVTFQEPIQIDPDPNVKKAPGVFKETGMAKRKQESYQRLTTESINYLDQISGYNMPFSLLWSLLIYGHDQTFVNKLAELVVDTEIEFGCYDSTTITTTTVDIEYTAQVLEEVETNVTQKNNNPTHKSEKGKKQVSQNYAFKMKEIDTLRTDNPQLKLNYADTWTAEYEREYKQEKIEAEKETSKTESNEETVLEEDWYQHVDDHYTGNEKPEDKDLAEGVDKVIDEKSEEFLKEKLKKGAEEANEYNKKFNYRYTALSKVVDKQNILDASKKVLKNKNIQNLMINMIIAGTTSKDQIEGVFNDENTLVSMTIEEIVGNNNIITMIILQSDIYKVINDPDIYNQITKNNKEVEHNKTYDAEITSVQIYEYKKIVYEKETITEETTKTEIKELSNNKVKWKTSIISLDGDNFVKLLFFSKYARRNLHNIDDWFFDSMEETLAIADLVDLMKYLLQCTYNQDYGISEERAEELKDLFDPTKMKKVSRTELTGGTIQEQTWNFFIKQGFSDAAAAGILANIENESAWDVDLDIAPCGGLFCFERSTGCFDDMKAYAASQGKEWTDLQIQLEYVLTQLPSTFKTYTGIGPYYYSTGEWCWWPTAMTLDDFKNLTDPQEAAEIFCRVYERPSITHLDRRKTSAQKYYDMYHGG